VRGATAGSRANPYRSNKEKSSFLETIQGNQEVSNTLAESDFGINAEGAIVAIGFAHLFFNAPKT
jgi:hypothetical protein